MVIRPCHELVASQRWDPDAYARNVGFVPELGQTILGWLAPQPGERILDLGCGDGKLTETSTVAGARVIGIDASAEIVRAARARGPTAELVDARELRFDADFDAVFSNAALRWILEPDRFRRALEQRTKVR